MDVHESPSCNTPDTSEGNDLFVAKSPGTSSSGFANTFRILENQIKRKLWKHSSLGSISEEEPTPLELELAARSRLSELCDTNVFKSEANISLNKLNKLDNVQNYIYHVTKGKTGVLSLKSKHFSSSPTNHPIDDYGKLTLSFFFLFNWGEFKNYVTLEFIFFEIFR